MMVGVKLVGIKDGNENFTVYVFTPMDSCTPYFGTEYYDYAGKFLGAKKFQTRLQRFWEFKFLKAICAL